MHRKHLAALVTAATVVAVAGPAAAASSTYTDKTGDVVTTYGAPKTPRNNDIDITSVTTNATPQTVTVTIKVKRVATDATHLQRYSAMIYSTTPRTSPDEPFIGVQIATDQSKTHRTPTCDADAIDADAVSDISSHVTCVRNPATDTVTFTIPTADLPQAPTTVYTLVASGERIKARSGRFRMTAGDFVTSMRADVS